MYTKESFNFYKFTHASTEDKSKFSFSLKKRKKVFYLGFHVGLLFVSISLLIIAGFLGFLIFGTLLMDTMGLIFVLAVLFSFGLVGLIYSLFFLITVLVLSLKAPGLDRFSLILQENYAELNGTQIQLPVAGKISITRGHFKHATFISSAKLELEGEIKTKLSMVTKFEQRLNYVEKRELAEKISQYLLIPLRDEFSLFDEGIYTYKSYLETLKNMEILEFDLPERYEFKVGENSQVILFPTFIIKPAVIILSVLAIITTALFISSFFLHNFSLVIPTLIPMAFILMLSLIFFGSISSDRIILTDDSITLRRRFFWGQKSEIFTSNLEDLQEIHLAPFLESAVLIFRGLKAARNTTVHPEQDMIHVYHFLNRLLLEKVKR